MGHSSMDPAFHELRPWNEGRLVGAKRALKQQQVWAVRFWLDQHKRLRDRALAEELWIYDEMPIERLGRIQDDLFRSCRLVVNTGIHAIGWLRSIAGSVFEPWDNCFRLGHGCDATLFTSQSFSLMRDQAMRGQVPHRITPLDGIRAIAVWLVMVSHSGAERFVPGGFGVTIFFFLSGYLITTLMRAEVRDTGSVDIPAFYLRRTLRIMPPLYITLILAAVLWATGLMGRVPTPDPLTVFSQFAFFHNYTELFGDRPSLPAPGLWSLAVEEHYYLVFPLFYIAVLQKMPGRRQALTCLALCVFPLLFRILNVATMTDFEVNHHWTHTRIDSILIGACLALHNNPVVDEDAWRPTWLHASGAILALLAALAIRNPVFRETIRYSIQGAALYVLFSYALWDREWISRLLSCGFARVTARYSYTLYLVHLPILFVLLGIGFKMTIVTWAAAIGMAFVYAAAMYAYVERPLGRLRARIGRDKAS